MPFTPSFSRPIVGRPSLCSRGYWDGGGLWLAACCPARPHKSCIVRSCSAARRRGGPHRADLRAQVRLPPSLGVASSSYSFLSRASPLSSPTLAGPWGPLQNVSIDFAGSWAANVREPAALLTTCAPFFRSRPALPCPTLCREPREATPRPSSSPMGRRTSTTQGPSARRAGAHCAERWQGQGQGYIVKP